MHEFNKSFVIVLEDKIRVELILKKIVKKSNHSLK